MSKLTTQLEQMREKVTEKEAESRAWEERVAGLSQQLKEEHSKLEVDVLGRTFILDFTYTYTV